MNIKIDGQAKGGRIFVDGELAGRIESFSGSGGMSYVYAFKPGGNPMAYYIDYSVVGRTKYRSHTTRAKDFARELLTAAGSVQAVWDAKTSTDESGGRLIETAITRRAEEIAKARALRPAR